MSGSRGPRSALGALAGAAAVGGCAVACACSPASAQAVLPSAPAADAAPLSKLLVPETVVVAPGARYRAGPLRRALLGANYRELWATPIAVELLDLGRFAGGLRPTERGGGLQTRSLRFDAGDGREYVFRSLDKDAGRVLPPELRETVVDDILQDQVSTFHPAGALVVTRLLDATGIRHARPKLVVLPDDPLLGEFRAEFARQLGTLEERAERGFDAGPETAGAAKVISSERLFEMRGKSAEVRVETRAFLAARLFDVFVGDLDRHRDQWRWARFGSDADDDVEQPWEPVPRDRDMAFVKHDGIAIAIARLWYPPLVGFERTYPGMLGLNWNAREIDRRLLAALERPVWDSVARALQAQLTDSVIDAAVAAMPAPFVAKNGPELRRSLVARRDHLPAAAAAFYALLAREVDLEGTDEPDLAEVTRLDDGSLEVSLSRRAAGGAAAGPPYLRRHFDGRETKEVRIYLHDGDDRAVVRGVARGVIVRIVGAGGTDELVDSTARRGRATRFYVSGRHDRVIRRPGTVVDRRRYVAPPMKRPRDPPRDWGCDWRPAPWVSGAPDVGLFLGPGVTRYGYAFRSFPYASGMTLQAGYAFAARRGAAQFTGEFRRPNTPAHATLRLRASGIEVLRFHGFGNETPSDEPDDFYRVRQSQYLVEPAYNLAVARNVLVSLGAAAQYAVTERRRVTLVHQLDPYGAGRFGQVGARLGLAASSGDRAGNHPAASVRGFDVAVGATVYPSLWDVATPFGESHATAAARWRVPAALAPTLALRVGGKRLWGTFPFHESAFLGGASTLRGWGEERFAGRASLYGNAELRMFLTKFFLILPGDLGVFGLADAGRVYASGERSDAWHTGVGGGLWIAPITRANTFTLAVVRGRERTGFYLRSGFLF